MQHRSNQIKIFSFIPFAKQLFALISLLGVAVLPAWVNAQQQVIGYVYEDLDLDQRRDSNEDGIPDARIVAIDSDGVREEVLTDQNGMYTLSRLTGDFVRLEFYLPEERDTEGESARYLPVLGGHTLLQFGRLDETKATQIDAGFYRPAVYSESFTHLVTPCYVNGDPLAEAPEGWTDTTVGEYDAVVSFPYDASGAPGDESYQSPSPLANFRQVGTIWGLAFDPERYLLYQSAFLKRHSGLGPLGLGGIYVTDFETGLQTEPFIDLTELGIEVGSIGSRDLTYNPNETTRDAEVFDQVGKVGLGDIDISTDGETLYIMNLFEREVISLDLSSKTITERYPMPDITCERGELRPFALKVTADERLFAGAVCSGENGGSRADLVAHVLERKAAGFESIFSFRLDRFERGLVNGSLDIGDWNVWNSEYNQNLNAYPVPVFSDIELDEDGSLIMAFFDRTGHNTGNGEYRPDGDELITLTSGGDVLRACFVEGGFHIEGTPEKCEQSQPQFEGQGVEYYTGLHKDPHFETGIGSLALLPSKGEVVATVYSPINYSTGGVKWLDNLTGDDRRAYQVYGGNEYYFGKLNGLGDLEFIRYPTPRVLAGYLWHDQDRDGAFTPGEPILDGITVELVALATDTVIGSAITDSEGRYRFSSGSGIDAEHARHTLSLKVGERYALRISTGQPGISGWELTPQFTDHSAAERYQNLGRWEDDAYQYSFELTEAAANESLFPFGFVAQTVAAEPTATAENGNADESSEKSESASKVDSTSENVGSLEVAERDSSTEELNAEIGESDEALELARDEVAEIDPAPAIEEQTEDRSLFLPILIGLIGIVLGIFLGSIFFRR